MKKAGFSELFGLGLRPHHFPEWRSKDQLPLLEVMADNFLFQKGGPGLAHLQSLREKTDFVLHGVGLNIGSPLPLNQAYLKALKKLKDRFGPSVVSDHCCFSSVAGGHSYDLLPLPRNELLLQRLSDKLDHIQNFLGCRFTLENVSSYVEPKDCTMTEMEFLNELAHRSGCGVLLDLNNIFVSAHNHGFDARSEIECLSPGVVTQFHVAGHSEVDDFFLDTHDQTIKDPVWDLLGFAWRRFGPLATILERDDEAPLDQLLAERAYGLTKAQEALLKISERVVENAK